MAEPPGATPWAPVSRLLLRRSSGLDPCLTHRYDSATMSLSRIGIREHGKEHSMACKTRSSIAPAQRQPIQAPDFSRTRSYRQ